MNIEGYDQESENNAMFCWNSNGITILPDDSVQIQQKMDSNAIRCRKKGNSECGISERNMRQYDEEIDTENEYMENFLERFEDDDKDKDKTCFDTTQIALGVLFILFCFCCLCSSCFGGITYYSNKNN